MTEYEKMHNGMIYDCLILITHDLEAAKQGNTSYTLLDGRLRSAQV